MTDTAINRYDEPRPAAAEAAGRGLLLAAGLLLMAVGVGVGLPAVHAGLGALTLGADVGGSVIGLLALLSLLGAVIGFACLKVGALLAGGDRSGHRAGVPLAAAVALAEATAPSSAGHTTLLAAGAALVAALALLPAARAAVAPAVPLAQPGEVVAAAWLTGIVAVGLLVAAGEGILLYASWWTVAATGLGGLWALDLLPGVLRGRPLSRSVLSALGVVALAHAAGAATTPGAALPVVLPIAALGLLWLPTASARWFGPADVTRRWVLR